MAGSLKLDGNEFLVKEGGQFKITNSELKLKSSGNTVVDSSGNALISEANGVVTMSDKMVPANSFMFRNKVINGEMQIAQRGNSTSVSATSYRACDRYHFVITNGGTWSISQSTDSPEGFGNSYKLECTTAKSSLDSDSRILIIQKIEGQNLQDLKKGTSSAKSVTLSFYVKTSLAGTYQVNLEDNDNTRIIGNTYTISSSEVNTWQYKTFTFAGDTTGALDNDNMDSLALHFVLVAGTDNSSGSLPTAWEAKTNTDRGAGLTVNLAATVGNTWYLTGVQLEIGSSATPFEHRPAGMELSLCQRYYQSVQMFGLFVFPYHTTLAFLPVPLFVPLRTASGVSVSKTEKIIRITTPAVYDYWIDGGSNFTGGGDWANNIYLQYKGNRDGTLSNIGMYINKSGSTNFGDQEPAQITGVGVNSSNNDFNPNGGYFNIECEL